MGSFGALCNFSDVKIFKRLLLPQFSSKFNQTLKKACISGKYRLLLLLATCQILKESIWHFEDKLPQLDCQYPFKAMLVSSSNSPSRASRPLGLLFSDDMLSDPYVSGYCLRWRFVLSFLR